MKKYIVIVHNKKKNRYLNGEKLSLLKKDEFDSIKDKCSGKKNISSVIFAVISVPFWKKRYIEIVHERKKRV